MKFLSSINPHWHWRTVLTLAGGVGLLLAIGSREGLPKAAEARDKDEPRVKAGRCVSEPGTLLERPKPKGTWQIVKPKAAVHSRELLLALPGSRAELGSSNGAVRLSLAGNWPAVENPPLYESAVVLHPSKGFDLDFTLERGRVILQNRKQKGAAGVRVRFQETKWEVTLDEPGAEVALELFRRWLFAPPTTGKAKPRDKPETSVVLVVLKGDVAIKVGTDEFSLSAPPGPALLSWTSRRGSSGPASLQELPAWANPKKVPRHPKFKAARAAVKQLQQTLEDKAPAAALADSLHGKKAASRSLAVYGLAAIDDLASVLGALENKKHAEVRLAAIHALRHWIGRARDNPAKLYQVVLQKKYSRGQAAILVQLLYGFSAQELARPETFGVLIEYLQHDRLAIRELAHWHLVMQVPEGRKIPYDAAGEPKELKKAYAAWKKKIPEGEVPHQRKPKKEE